MIPSTINIAPAALDTFNSLFHDVCVFGTNLIGLMTRRWPSANKNEGHPMCAADVACYVTTETGFICCLNSHGYYLRAKNDQQSVICRLEGDARAIPEMKRNVGI